MTPRAVLWLAVVLAEVGACVLAVRLSGFDQGVTDHLRKLVRMLRVAAQKLAGAGDVAVVERAAHVKRDRLEVGGHAGSIAASGESRKENRPVAFLLACAVVIDLAVGLHDPPSSWGLSALAAAGPRPRVGLARAAYHLADALVMAWPGLLAVTCGRVFLGNSRGAETSRKSANPGRDLLDSAAFRWRRTGRRVLAGCYLGAVVGLAAAYPLGQVRTQQVLLAWEGLALAFAAGAIFAGWRRVTAGGAPWTRAHGVLLVLVPVEAAVAVIGPFAREDVFNAWDVARWQYLVAFLVVGCVLAAPAPRR